MNPKFTRTFHVRFSHPAAIALPALVMTVCNVAPADEPTRNPVVRIAELEIKADRLDDYKVAVKEEMEKSVRDEPGVLAIYAVAEKDNPRKLRFFEIYADDAAFKAHLESPHFKKYRTTTNDMIVSRKLIETIPVQLSTKIK